jgi:hypothetical protein
VIERLTQLREQLGQDGTIAELNPGGRIPLELETRTLRLHSHEVMPAS